MSNDVDTVSEIQARVEEPYNMLDLTYNSDEAVVLSESLDTLNDIDGTVHVLNGVEVLDDDVIADVESKFPGIIYDNVPYNIRYMEAGLEDAKETAKQIQQRVVAVSAKATIVMIDKFAGFMRDVAGSNISEGVVSSLTGIEAARKELKNTSSVTDENKLLKAYQNLMGVKAESSEKVIEMIGTIKSSKSALECLKTYPNDKYDKIFSPLLAASVSDSSNIFSCFDKLNKTYARQLIDTIEKVKSDLNKMISDGNYDAISNYNENLIPDDIMETLAEIVGTLGVKLDHHKGILKQTTYISQQMAKMLKPDEDSLRKKASVVNTIVYRYKDMDKAFKDIGEAIAKLSEYSKEKDVGLKELKSDLRRFKIEKPIKRRAKEILRGDMMKHGNTHHRIMNELDDLWSLIDLMVRMCISYTTMYGIVKINLDVFRKQFADFVEAVNAITESEKSESEEVDEEDDYDSDTDI